MPNPTVGSTLGAYRVEGPIGSGSMGEVFKAIDPGLNRRVAIKILSEKHRDSPELRARFVREGRAVAAISHPNVVQVFATGSFDERPYIAMELLDGTDLGSAVEKNGPLDSATAAHAVLDSSQGLAAASKAGLIHRDVKPSNLVRLSSGVVKVTDFGLAKPVDPGTEPALTAMGVVVGTPDYIAPEQARGEKIDERVDIYALGGSLYYMLTGIPPFRTGKPAEDKYLKVVARHLRNPPPDASTVNPNADRELADLAKMMMAKRPGDRPSYQDLAVRLTGILSRLDPGAVPEIVVASRDRSRPNTQPNPVAGSAPSGPSAAVGKASGNASAVEDSIQPAKKVGAVPGWLIAFTVLCVGVFVAGLVVYLKNGEASATPPAKIDAGAPPPPADAAKAITPPDAAPAKPDAAAPAPDAAPAIDAAAPPDDAGSAAAADPTPPEGMLLVKKDGKALYFVAAHPVSQAQFKEMFSGHKQDGKPEAAVTNVTYDEARSYVSSRGGRLLRDAEWDIAAVTPGFVVETDVLEWVEADGDKRVARQHGKHETKPGKGEKDVTFRMAKDL